MTHLIYAIFVVLALLPYAHAGSISFGGGGSGLNATVVTGNAEDNQLLVGFDANAVAWVTIPNCANAVTSKLLFDQATNIFSCGVDQTGAPGAGDVSTVGNCPGGDCGIETGTDIFPLLQEGTANTFETTFSVVDPTADHTIAFPNNTGTVAVAVTAPVTLSATGVVALTQDAGTNVAANLEEEGNINATAVTGNVVDDQTLVGTAANVAVWKTVPDCDNAVTSKLLYDQTTNEYSCGTDQTGAPGTGDISTVGFCTSSDCGIETGTDIFPFLQEGTANDFETTFSVVDPTADQAIAFPNNSGTVAVAVTTPVTLSATGVVALTQDAGTNVAANLEEEGEINATAVTGNTIDDQVVVGSGANTAVWKTVPDCDNSVTSKLLYDQTTNEYTCGVDQTGAPGTGDISTVGFCTSSDCGIETGTDIFPFLQEGTANAFETTFSVTDPTADQTIAFPNNSGTVGVVGIAPITMSAAGAIGLTQHAGTNIEANLEEEGEINATAVTGNIVDDQTLVGTAASVAVWKTIPDCDNAVTSKLLYDQTTNEYTCGVDQTGAPGTGDISTVGFCTSSDCGIETGTDIFPFLQEGTANAFETTFSVVDPTADRTIAFPNASGTVGVAGTAPVTMSAAGAVGLTQNAGTDVTTDLEEEGQINVTAVTGNAVDDQVVVGSGANTAAWVSLPLCSDPVANKLLYDPATNTFSCGTDQGAGGDIASVGSCTTDDCFVEGTNHTLTFEGSTADAFETTFQSNDPTADHTISLPANSGTVAVAVTAPVTLSATGVVALTQNAGTDVTANLEEEAHATEHQHNGGDEVGTSIPAANAIPKAGANGTLDNTWTTATSSNIASAIIARDPNGNFTGGIFTGDINTVPIGIDALPDPGTQGRIRFINNAATISTCTDSGGTETVICFDNGVAWVPLGVTSAGGLQAEYDVGNDILLGAGGIDLSGAVSEATAVVVCNTGCTSGWKLWVDAALGPQFKAFPDANTILNIASTFASVVQGAGTELEQLTAAGVHTYSNAGRPQKSVVLSVSTLTMQGACVITTAAVVSGAETEPYIVCTGQDTDGFNTSFLMPDSWDGGTITVELAATNVAATPLGDLQVDFSARCVRGNIEDDAAITTTGEQPATITFSNNNLEHHTTTAALTPNGTCAAGARLKLQGQIDDVASTSTQNSSIKIRDLKIEYTVTSRDDN